jgi:hypothetical protein
LQQTPLPDHSFCLRSASGRELGSLQTLRMLR